MRGAVLFILFLSFLIGVFFYPASLGGGIIYSGDFTGSDGLDLNLPLKAHLGESLRNHRIPLWTDKIFCGFPLLCEGQTGIFYPPDMLLSLLPPMWCFNGLIFFHLLLAGTGIFLYARYRKMTWQAAAMVSIAFAFNGFFLTNLRHLNTFAAASWFPLLFYCVDRHIDTRNPKWLLLWSIFVSMQWLIGHPAMTYLGLFGIFILYLAAWIRDLRKGSGKLFFPLCFTGAVLFSGILAAVQILPTLELIPLSSRSSMTLAKVSNYPFTLESLRHFITPFFIGNPARATYPLDRIYEKGVFWENCMYIGILPIVLALVSLLLWKKRDEIRYYWWLTISGLILAFGPGTAIFRILWHIIPGFQLFRFPNRFLLFSIIGLTLLGGATFDFILEKIKGKPARAILSFLVITMVILNTWWFNREFNTVVSPAWLEKPATVELPKPDVARESYRIHSFAAKYMWQQFYIADGGWLGERANLNSYRSLLAPDYNLIYGVAQSGEKTWIEGGMAPSRRAGLEELLEKELTRNVQGKVANISDEAEKILGLLNVRYVLSFFILSSPRLMGGSEGPEGMRTYETMDWLPRAFVAKSFNVINEPQAELNRMFSGDFNPRDEVLLEEDPGIPAVDTSGSVVEKAFYDAERIDLDVSMSATGILFLSDTWFPGWKVSIDGREGKILRADYAFRAVAVPAGQHSVRFTYEPGSYRIGLILSIIGWAAALCAWIVLRKGLREKTPHP